MPKIVFDVDGTLITLSNQTPKRKIIHMFRIFEALGWQMYVHSAGGIKYAQHWVSTLQLNAKAVEKGDPRLQYDIAVDDRDYNWEDHINAKMFIWLDQDAPYACKQPINTNNYISISSESMYYPDDEWCGAVSKSTDRWFKENPY